MKPFLAAALGLVIVAPAFAQEVPQYDAETFYMTTSWGLAPSAGHAFSPEEDKLLASSDSTGVFNAYALSIPGGEAEVLTESDTNAVFALSYFPDDARILYTFDEGGNEQNHVYVRGLNGETTDLTPGDELKAGFVGWEADGEAFYLSSTERDQQNFDLYRYDAETFERELVFENEGYQLSAISRDGRWLALDKPNTSADSDIYLVDLQSEAKEPQLISEHDGDIAYSAYEFTPEGDALVYATNEEGEFSQAWTYDLENGEKQPLIEADWDVMFVTFSPQGTYRVHGVNADAQTEITITNRETGEPLSLEGAPAGDIGSIRFSDDETQMAFTVDSDTAPTDIYVLNMESGEISRLTDALNPEIDQQYLVEGEVARFESYDGLEIPGILYRPLQASAEAPAPALVYVHGGPGGQSRKGYNPTIQHLVNHGYAVYAINNRGSSGYGKTFFHMDDRKHGEADLDDVVQARDWLAGMDWIDGDEIGVIGGSYGGYMVAAALAFRPEVFDAGIDIFGVTNWERTLTSIPPWWESFKKALYDEMGDPATDAERHRAISPLFHAENITKPLLVVQGENDPRVLKVESDELVEAVRANDVPVEYVVFDDEGHGFRKRENRITASEAYLDFLNAHLRGADEAG